VVTTGYAAAWPKTFGTKKGSELAKAMDKARGGYFTSIPKSYPSKAWYSYNDKTCTYNCQCTEYIYWAFTSILGGQKARLSTIQNEWKLNTRDKVKTQDPAVFKILTDPTHNLPTKLPNGKYNPNGSNLTGG